jgi:hypothetical protein
MGATDSSMAADLQRGPDYQAGWKTSTIVVLTFVGTCVGVALISAFVHMLLTVHRAALSKKREGRSSFR